MRGIKTGRQIVLRKVERQKLQTLTLRQVLDLKAKINPKAQTFNPVEGFGHRNNNQLAGLVNRELGLKEQSEAGYLWSQEFAQKALREARKNEARKRGQSLMHEILRGRLGGDLFLILFAVLGVLSLPALIFLATRKQKELVLSSRSLSPEQINELDDEDLEELDDVSIQDRINTQFQEEIQASRLKFEKVERQIKELEKELYGEFPWERQDPDEDQ